MCVDVGSSKGIQRGGHADAEGAMGAQEVRGLVGAQHARLQTGGALQGVVEGQEGRGDRGRPSHIGPQSQRNRSGVGGGANKEVVFGDFDAARASGAVPRADGHQRGARLAGYPCRMRCGDIPAGIQAQDLSGDVNKVQDRATFRGRAAAWPRTRDPGAKEGDAQERRVFDVGAGVVSGRLQLLLRPAVRRRMPHAAQSSVVGRAGQDGSAHARGDQRTDAIKVKFIVSCVLI